MLWAADDKFSKNFKPGRRRAMPIYQPRDSPIVFATARICVAARRYSSAFGKCSNISGVRGSLLNSLKVKTKFELHLRIQLL